MDRLNGEDVDMLILEVFREISDDGKKSIKPAELYASLRQKKWDIDDNDIRSAMSKLFAEKRALLTFDRRLKLLDPA